MNVSGRRIGIQAAVASAVFLGFAPILGKQAILFGFSPLAVVALRTNIATALLIIIMALFQRKFFYIYPVGLIGCGIAGITNGMGSILYYSALTRLDASLGHLLYSFYPLFVALWLMVDRQPISRVTILRLLVSIPGMYLLISSGDKQVDITGALLMLGSALLYALHLLINQRVLYEVPAQTVTLYTLIFMGLTVLIAYIFFDRTLPISNTPWWPILGMAAVTFMARLTLFVGVKHLGGLQTALLGLGELLITVALAQSWLGERLSNLQWIGAILLGLSLILVGYDHHTPDKRHSNGLLAWLKPPHLRNASYPRESNP